MSAEIDPDQKASGANRLVHRRRGRAAGAGKLAQIALEDVVSKVLVVRSRKLHASMVFSPMDAGQVKRSKFMLALLLCCGLSALGCVRRRMTVRTNPPGALVSVDNQVIGTSPAATPFVFYGTREFRIEADGFRTETIRRRFKAPWYQWPGVDFVAETLWPGEIRDERIIDVTLVPKTLPTSEEVISRADSLRGQANVGVVTGRRQ